MRLFVLVALVAALLPGGVAAAPTPVPGPASAPSVHPAVSPVPSPSRVAEPTVVTPTATATEGPTEDADATDEPDWRAFVPSDTADHLATMDRAAHESGCGVPWQLLAAISRVESDFGRNMATSSAGAIGYGQFLPDSWQAFGQEGNAYDYRDALPAIARYLCQSGLARDPRAALFAYNHADWYVDLVLDLAVRYDRMAPGAPTPEVLGINPELTRNLRMQYAHGRDLTVQSKPRSVDQARWLGIPWRGRAPGAPIEIGALEATTLDMLRGAFGAAPGSAAPDDGQDAMQPLDALAARAWQSGLLAWPSTASFGWSLAELRHRVESGAPVVVLVSGAALPGHTGTEAQADQPLLVIGAAPDGLIVSDPTFSSSLGYGLEVGDVDLLKAWQAANPPLQALAFSRAPRRTEPHLAVIDDAPVIPRIVVTPPPPAQSHVAVISAPVTTPTPVVAAAAPVAAREPERDWSGAVLIVAAALLGSALGIRRLRGGRSARSAPSTAMPPRSDQ